jgi:hypothetical protein
MTTDPPPALQQAQIAEYAEVCRSHTAVSDFRAKLLALLPVVSGVATGLLVVQGSEKVTSIEPGVLIAVGLFGFLATFGLFLYELWLVDECHQLRRRAALLERDLLLGESAQFGAGFRFKQQSLREVYGSAWRRRRDDAMRTGDPEEWLRPEGGNPLDRRFIGPRAAGHVVYVAAMLAWLGTVAYGVFLAAG